MPRHPGHQRIDQKASFAAWVKGLEEGRAIGKKLYRVTVRLQQIADSIADSAVVVHHEDGGQRVPLERQRLLLLALLRTK